MVINIGDTMCKYTIVNGAMVAHEGIVEERAGRCKWVNFGPDITGEKIPRYKDLGRVWKGGETLWLAERDDAKALSLFTDYHIGRITELEAEIASAKGLIKSLKGSKLQSKCFTGEVDKKAAKQKARNKYMRERYDRDYKEGWDCSDFVDPEQYARRKIAMLEKEMYIQLTTDDILHLKSLTTQTAIDAAVRAIINRAW